MSLPESALLPSFLLLHRLRLLSLGRGGRVSVRVGVATPLGESDELLHSQEGHDPGQYPQADDHVLHVIMAVGVVVIMMVGVVVVFMMVGVALVAVIVGGDGVGDEMEEGVAQKTPRGEGQEHLQEGGVVLGVLERDAEEYEEGGSADESSGDKRVGPQLPGALKGSREFQEEPPRGGRVGVIPMGQDHAQWEESQYAVKPQPVRIHF